MTTTTSPSLSLPRSRALAWARPRAPLAALLAATAVLYLWGLGRSGTANEFYAAAVKAGTESWKAFLFGSFDSASFITVDKPPAALWAMELSGRLFGFSSWSLLAPQALEGVAAVWLLYATMRRWFGTGAALLSGALLALTPAAVLMFRFDNPDALLVLALVGAAYATTRALEQASPRWLALAGALVGLGFLTKMLEAFLVVPALGLAYLVAAPTSLPRRVRDLALAVGALAVSGGWWVALVELTPKSDRPFVGGSTNDSILDLIWGYNGLGRIEGGSGAGPGGGASFSGTPGLLRLFNDQMGTEIGWLLPAALVVLLAGLAATARRPRTDRTRAALVLWGGWLLVAGLTFSEMSGIVHPYYTNLLAPPIAALVGTGVTLLWRARRDVAACLVLAVCLASTSVWSYLLLDRTPAWHPWLRFLVLAGGLVAAVAVVALAEAPRRVAAAAAAAALVAGAAAPAGYALSTAATPHTGSTPSSGPASAGGFGRPGFGGGSAGASTVGSALAALIRSGAKGYTWAAAADSSMTAGPLELATGTAVMSLGGFTGSDDAISLAAFERLVAAGRIHYYVAGGGPGGGGFGRRGGNDAVAAWVEAHFAALTVGGTTVYDLTRHTS